MRCRGAPRQKMSRSAPPRRKQGTALWAGRVHRHRTAVRPLRRAPWPDPGGGLVRRPPAKSTCLISATKTPAGCGREFSPAPAATTNGKRTISSPIVLGGRKTTLLRFAGSSSHYGAVAEKRNAPLRELTTVSADRSAERQLTGGQNASRQAVRAKPWCSTRAMTALARKYAPRWRTSSAIHTPRARCTSADGSTPSVLATHSAACRSTPLIRGAIARAISVSALHY